MKFLPPASMLPTLLASSGWAAELQIFPTFGLQQLYTDNVNLAPHGQERSDWVTAVRPGVTAAYSGARLKFSANYTAEVLYHSSDSSTQINNQFSGGTQGSMELVPQFLFLDTGSTVAQYNTSINGPLATSNINTTGNRSTVRTTNLSPFIRYNFQGEAVGTVRYTYSVVTSDTTGSALSDSAGGVLAASIASGPSYLTGWALNYTRQKVDYDVGSSYTLQNFAGTLSRRVTPVLLFSASAGYESNDYATLSAQQPSGVTYNVGVGWTPTPRTNFAATAGHRYYGRSYSLDFSHHMRTLFVSATYGEDITTTRAQFLVPTQTNTAGYLDTLLLARYPDPVERKQAVQQEIQRSGLPASLTVPVNFVTDQIFLQKSWNASAGIQGALHTIVANFFTTTREQQTPGLSSGVGDFATGTEVDQYGGSLAWSYRITPYTSSVLSASYTRNEQPATAREDTVKSVRVGLSSQLGRYTTGALQYQRLQSDSTNVGAAIYTENQVSAQLYMQFH